MRDIDALKALMDDIDILKNLEDKFDKKPNIFSILKVENKEIRHSNILAWLLNPKENHNLGSLFLNEFIKNILTKEEKIILTNKLDFKVLREWKNIDLLLFNEKEKMAIAIENKIHAGEHDNQLERYYNTMQEYYSDYNIYYIYLTLDGEYAPYLSDIWKPMSYKVILNILDNIINKHKLNDTVNLIINNYIQTVRSLMKMENPEIKELCMQIYEKHKHAIDLIVANIPEGGEPFLRDLSYWIKNEWSHKFNFKNVNNHKWFEFFTSTMDEILPNLNGIRPYKYFISIEDNICKMAFELQYEGLVNTPTLDLVKEADKKINNHELGKSIHGDDIKWIRYAFKTWKIDITNASDEEARQKIKEDMENILFKEIPNIEKQLKELL